MNIHLLTPEERFDATIISTVAFHGRMEDPQAARERSLTQTVEDWGAFTDDGRMMAHIINNRYECYLDGHLIVNGGIGAVSTLPEYRNVGSIRGIFEQLLPHAFEHGEVISTLYPFNHAFYRKFGYETVAWKDVYRLPTSALKDYRFHGEAVLYRGGDAQDYADLYNRFASGYNLAMLRSEEAMRHHLSEEYYKTRKFCYLLREQGEPVAYVIFQDVYREQSALLRVEEIAWLGRAGFKAALGFLARFTADYGEIELPLPRDVALFNIVHSPDAYAITKSTRQDYMIRVVNAQKLLAALRVPSGVSFTVQLSDGMIPQNNGTWQVSAHGVEKTALPPDIALSHQALGQLACGGVSLSEALYRDDVTVLKHADALHQVFTRKPILVYDHF